MQPSTATTEQEGHLTTNIPAESLGNADDNARREITEGFSNFGSTNAQATTVVLTSNSARKPGEKGQKSPVGNNGGARKDGRKKGGNGGRDNATPRGRDGYNARGQSSAFAAHQHQSQHHQQSHLLDSTREMAASPLSGGTPTAAAVSNLVDDRITNLPHIRGHSHTRAQDRHHCCIKSSSKDGGTNATANESKQALLDHVPCPYSPPSPLFPISKLKQRFKRILKQRYPDHVPDYIVRAGPVDAASAAGELMMSLILCHGYVTDQRVYMMSRYFDDER